MRKLMTVAVLLALFPAMAGAAKASTSLTTFSDQACPTDSAKYAVTLHNPGAAEDTYFIDVEGPWSDAATVSKGSVSVEPGERSQVYVWVRAPTGTAPGTYAFTVRARSSNTGQVTESGGTIDVMSCRAVDVSVDDAARTVCRANTAEYAVRVANRGQVAETYDLSASSGELSTGEVTLEPGTSTTVTLSRSSDAAVTEEIEVTAASRESYAEDAATLAFASETCRSVDVSVDPRSAETCRNASVTYEAEVTNTGSVSDTYTVSVRSQADNVTLAPNASTTVTADVTRPAGDHEIAARAVSTALDAVAAEETASLAVSACHDLELAANRTGTVTMGDDDRTLLTFHLSNNGSAAQNYSVVLDAPSWMDVKPSRLAMGPGEQEPVYLYVSPDYFSNGTYTAAMVVEGEEGPRRTAEVNVTVDDRTVTAELAGGTVTPTGAAIRSISGLAALILTSVLLFVGGYWYFTRREPVVEETAEPRRDT